MAGIVYGTQSGERIPLLRLLIFSFANNAFELRRGGTYSGLTLRDRNVAVVSQIFRGAVGSDKEDFSSRLEVSSLPVNREHNDVNSTIVQLDSSTNVINYNLMKR